MLTHFELMNPLVSKSSYFAPSATIAGSVVVYNKVSIWPGVVLRGKNQFLVEHILTRAGK
jgi:carbonic anhydrase/acetyltransferase-like protein (isoleucine patch superfamily)